jgi:hypothetical protein
MSDYDTNMTDEQKLQVVDVTMRAAISALNSISESASENRVKQETQFKITNCLSPHTIPLTSKISTHLPTDSLTLV